MCGAVALLWGPFAFSHFRSEAGGRAKKVGKASGLFSLQHYFARCTCSVLGLAACRADRSLARELCSRTRLFSGPGSFSLSERGRRRDERGASGALGPRASETGTASEGT